MSGREDFCCCQICCLCSIYLDEISIYIFEWNINIIKVDFSKNYSTRHEAEVAEKKFALEVENKEINLTDMTFQDLYDEFYAYKLDKVKHTTIRTYQQRIPRLS